MTAVATWRPREDGSTELLDEPRHDPDELRHSLEAVTRANRWFGGLRALRSHLGGARRAGEELLFLDVGTGDGQVLTDLIAWGRAAGAAWRGVGVDRHAQAASIAGSKAARDAAVTIVRADALSLPFPDDSCDVVLCTLTLHHFAPGSDVAAVAEMARVARGRVLVNDLHRHPVNYALAKLLSWTLWRGDRLTRHDGPLSVLRSFTPEELLRIGLEAGLRSPRVRRHPPYRLVLEGAP